MSTDKLKNSTKIFHSRYFFLAFVLVFMLLLIMVRTSFLQLSSAESKKVPETRGKRAQMQLEAARGDIVDANGLTLAYSVTEPYLYICNAGLSTKALNQMLLDLAELMTANGVALPNNLNQYFDFSLASKSKESQVKPDFVFKKDLAEIERWQQNQDLFNLKAAKDGQATGDQVKLQPQDFYDYLLYDKFEIEDRKAGGDLIYTYREAMQIMQLRYLILEHNWQYIQGQAILLGGPINQTISNKIGEQNQKYAGILVSDLSSRQYSQDSEIFSHVLGYTGKISAGEYEQLKKLSYSLTDTVGKSGVELSAERYLHGSPGLLPYGYWQKQQDGSDTFITGKGGIDPRPGYKVRLTMEKELQETTLRALEDNIEALHEQQIIPDASAAVLLDAKTGAVLAMASVPYYNPQDFSLAQFDREAADRVTEYFEDNERKPMLNRTISEIYAPASTFKTFTSIAAIEHGVVSPAKQVYVCNGTEEIGYRVWQCYERPHDGHGPLNLHDAMVTSCNLYFYKMGIDTGIENLTETYKLLGMGEYTNIDLPGEVKGIRPSPELKRQTQALPEDQIWFPADTAQSAIGQSFNSYTLMQIARGIGGLATGQLVQPHVIKEISDNQGVVVKPEVIELENTGISKTAIEMVRQAMEGLAHREGTLNYTNFHHYPVKVAMKTGTAEVQNSSSENISINALFVCYAPADDPEVVFAGVVENAGKGSGLSNVAKRVLDAYFGFK